MGSGHESRVSYDMPAHMGLEALAQGLNRHANLEVLQELYF